MLPRFFFNREPQQHRKTHPLSPIPEQEHMIVYPEDQHSYPPPRRYPISLDLYYPSSTPMMPMHNPQFMFRNPGIPINYAPSLGTMPWDQTLPPLQDPLARDSERRRLKLPPEAFERIEIDGQVRFKCTVEGCSSIFTRRSLNARSHWLTHQNIKPFKCQSCGASFTRAADCKRHQKTHEREP
ncbi:hypothetical protein EDD86DRAFT_116933 [Gorgonomyces haynaldii]|nr:hypothetical protein EDD86DRAFT_116933 [Gorgonomyces haynaldii]